MVIETLFYLLYPFFLTIIYTSRRNVIYLMSIRLIENYSYLPNINLSISNLIFNMFQKNHPSL